MKLRAICGIIAALLACRWASNDSALAEVAKYEPPKFWSSLRPKLLKGVLVQIAMDTAKHGAFMFLNSIEAAALKDLIANIEFEQMEAEQKDRVLKAGLITNMTDSLYRYDYDCAMYRDRATVTFRYNVPRVNVPRKWLMDHFS